MYADCKNQNANIYNLPERILMLIATFLALTYSIRIENIPMMVNYAPNLFLDVIACSTRIYYIYINRKKNIKYIHIDDAIHDEPDLLVKELDKESTPDWYTV
jgi:hypothetical protein